MWELIAALIAAVSSITGPATATETAVRLDPPDPPPTVPAEPTGIYGLPFAPDGLDNCDEMMWYAAQFGLPERFRALGWRESNCRNEDGVKTFCCHGYWQMYTSLHLRDHRLAPKMAWCGVTSHHDLNSDTPLDKQRQACAAKALFDTVGYSAWAL